jgi:hypothetical protein
MLRLNVEALEVSSFETEAGSGKGKDKGKETTGGGGGPDTRMPLCTHCTTCNWTA